MTYSTWPGPPPRLLKLVRGLTRLLKLVRALQCLLNLVLDGCLIIGSHDSGAALIRDDRGRGRYGRACLESLVRCGHGAGKR